MKALLHMAAAVFCTSGCTSSELIGQADGRDVGSEDTSPPPDASVDPIADSRIDPIIDATDTRIDPVDGIADTSRDFFHDTPASTCHVIEQTGCSYGSWCGWAFDETTCTHYQTCFPGPAGTLELGEECSLSSTELCVPGADCFWGDFMPGEEMACREWCEDDDDCSLVGTTCSRPVSYIPVIGPCAGVHIDLPYQLCH